MEKGKKKLLIPVAAIKVTPLAACDTRSVKPCGYRYGLVNSIFFQVPLSIAGL